MKKFFLLIACAAMICACGGNSKSASPQPTEESKTLEASSLSMSGKHANLFKVSGDTYKVMLVQTNSGWQVRIKVPMTLKNDFNKYKDHKKYERELSSVYGKLLNSSEVEVTSLSMNGSDWDMILQEDADTHTNIRGETWSYKNYTYETAKSIYDRTVAVELTGIELEEAEETTTSSIFDDEELEDLKETTDDMLEILEAEAELINALGGFL